MQPDSSPRHFWPRHLLSLPGSAWSRLLSLGWSGTMLGLFVLAPFCLLLRVSLAPMDTANLWGSGLTLHAFGAMGEYGIGRAVGWSLAYSLSVSALGILLAFPLTWLIAGMSKRSQTGWLIFLLSTLALSDVLVAFSWQVMLARKQWIVQLLLWLGAIDKTASLVPGVGAVFCSLLYITLPFSVLLLYPALSRIDRSLIEAARTMGATPWRSFFTLVLPLNKNAILTALALSIISTMGAYTAPLVLGRPESWPLAVIIGKVALSAQNFPLAAAMSLLLLAITLSLALTLLAIAKRRTL